MRLHQYYILYKNISLETLHECEGRLTISLEQLFPSHRKLSFILHGKAFFTELNNGYLLKF